MDICSTQPCRLTKSYQTILDEQCSSIRDEQWIRYKDQDFEKRRMLIQTVSFRELEPQFEIPEDSLFLSLETLRQANSFC